MYVLTTWARQVHTHTHTHPLCTSTTLRANRCSSFILNHRRQGKPEKLHSSLLCEITAWRNPEEDKAIFILEAGYILSMAFHQHGYWMSPRCGKQHYNNVKIRLWKCQTSLYFQPDNIHIDMIHETAIIKQVKSAAVTNWAAASCNWL